MYLFAGLNLLLAAAEFIEKDQISSNFKKKKCAVAGCYNSIGKPFHRFPKDPNIAELWIKVCRQPLPKFARICGKHFERLQAAVQTKFLSDEVTQYIIKLFLKVRFYNRIKWLNVDQKANLSSEKIRGSKQTCQHLF